MSAAFTTVKSVFAYLIMYSKIRLLARRLKEPPKFSGLDLHVHVLETLSTDPRLAQLSSVNCICAFSA